MAHYLASDGVNDYVQLASPVSVAAGVPYRIEIDFQSVDGPDFGVRLSGNSGVNTSRVIVWKGTTPNTVGPLGAIATTGAINTLTRAKWAWYRTDAINNRLSVDDVVMPAVIQNSGNFSFSLLLTELSATNSRNPVNLYSYKVFANDILIHHWDPSASNGTGNLLLDVVGGNHGTLVNFPADDSHWVFYESGGGSTQHQTSSASGFQRSSALATTSPLNSQQQNTSAGAAQVFNAAATSEPVNEQQQQTSGSAGQKFSATATALPGNSQNRQTTATAAQAYTEATQTTASNSQNRQSTGQVVSVGGFIASTGWVNTVNLGNVQNRQTSGSAVQAFSAQATVTKTNKQHRKSGGQVSAATTFAASSSWVNTVLQIAAYTQQIKTRSISKKHYQTSTRHSYHIQSRSNHKIELTTQSGGVYMQEINFKQGASALLVIDHQIDNEQVAGINAAKYELYGRTGQVLITKELGSGIAFNAGKIEIQLTDTDTAELSGNYNHQCVAKDLADRTFYPLNGDITFSATKPRL